MHCGQCEVSYGSLITCLISESQTAQDAPWIKLNIKILKETLKYSTATFKAAQIKGRERAFLR